VRMDISDLPENQKFNVVLIVLLLMEQLALANTLTKLSVVNVVFFGTQLILLMLELFSELLNYIKHIE
jgi:hypothetical protein